MIFCPQTTLYQNPFFQSLPPASAFSGNVSYRGVDALHLLEGVDRHYRAPIQNDTFTRAYTNSETLRGITTGYELSSGGRYQHGKTLLQVVYPSLRRPHSDRDK